MRLHHQQQEVRLLQVVKHQKVLTKAASGRILSLPATLSSETKSRAMHGFGKWQIQLFQKYFSLTASLYAK